MSFAESSTVCVDRESFDAAVARGEWAVLLRPLRLYARPVPDDELHKEDGNMSHARSSLERRVDRIEAYLESGMNVNLSEWEADQERSREAGAEVEAAAVEAGARVEAGHPPADDDADDGEKDG